VRQATLMHWGKPSTVIVGKLMAAIMHGLSDRNVTVRKNYANALGNICKVAKASSIEKLIERLHSWYMEKEGEIFRIVSCSTQSLCHSI